MKPGPRLLRQYNEPYRPAASIALAVLLLAGCASTQVPLKPERGYPRDWPRLMPLSEGLSELNGVYANHGVATAGDGKPTSMNLADLVPRTTPHKGASAEPDSGCEDCVALRVMPAKYKLLSSARLRFTVQRGSSRHTFDIDSAGNANATFYMLQSSGGSFLVGWGVSNIEVRLTCAEDGSLVAQIRNVSGVLLLMLIPITTQNEYVWARFERIRELNQFPATDAAPHADQ